MVPHAKCGAMMGTTCSGLTFLHALGDRATLPDTGTTRFQSVKVSDKYVCYLNVLLLVYQLI